MKKNLRYKGIPLTKKQHRMLLSVLKETIGRFRINKSEFKSPRALLHAIEYITGIDVNLDDEFQKNVERIFLAIQQTPRELFDQRIARIDVEEIFLIGGIVRHISVTHDQVVENAARAPLTPPSREARDKFYQSWEWRTLRMETLIARGRRCECCGSTPSDLDSAGNPVRICVDHIKALSIRWDLRLDPSNLQVLCDECNQGKGAWDSTDWRNPAWQGAGYLPPPLLPPILR